MRPFRKESAHHEQHLHLILSLLLYLLIYDAHQGRTTHTVASLIICKLLIDVKGYHAGYCYRPREDVQ